jgi:replicative DNA helicase
MAEIHVAKHRNGETGMATRVLIMQPPGFSA